MFKAETATTTANGGWFGYADDGLAGSGYHYLYKGTYEQAVANGAATENWIAGKQNEAGKWEFDIPVTADELGKVVPVVAVSQSYYEKYLNGQNSIDRAFDPPPVQPRHGQATLVTDDYKTSKEITVTNNVSMFKPGETATLDYVGRIELQQLQGGSGGAARDEHIHERGLRWKAFDGAGRRLPSFPTPRQAPSPFLSKWVATFGTRTLVNLANGEPFYISFKSASNGKWYERKATLNEEAGTLVFDPSAADYTAVNTAKEAAAAIDRDKYTEESLAALDLQRLQR